jgi:hypothetical protein
MSDSEAAVLLGAPGAPPVMVDGWLIDGTPTDAALASLIRNRIEVQDGPQGDG